MEPASPIVCFRYFDILLFLIIAIANLLVWKFNIVRNLNWKVILFFLLLIFLLFPLLSTRIEVANVYRKNSMVDGFNLIYILLTWPIWWLIGIIEFVFLKYIIQKGKVNH
jgi:hypothetical protein